MERNKKIIILSHCVLNQNAVVQPLARAKGPMKCASIILESECGIYQLPCPEKRMCGMGRVGMNADQYGSIKGFHELCADITEDVISDMIDYRKYGYEIKGLIAIQGSPSCSVTGDRGVLMQHLILRLKEEGFDVPFVEIPKEGESESFYEKVRDILQ